MIPTSNHNHLRNKDAYLRLYIFWFLHQTTTWGRWQWQPSSCISFDSYIKPQLTTNHIIQVIRCISFDSYIKLQLLFATQHLSLVVYLLIPTSNHNLSLPSLIQIFVVYLLIPTSNHNIPMLLVFVIELYIFWFLHQTTTSLCQKPKNWRCISFDSYIKPQHIHAWCGRCRGCISFDSYIKPQLAIIKGLRLAVVYLLIPTSNHNCVAIIFKPFKVVYLLIPTSNHNSTICSLVKPGLYIFWFLHQTTTLVPRNV